MGGIISMPDIPFMVGPPPEEKYVFRMQPRDLSNKAPTSESSKAMASSSGKRRASALPGSVPAPTPGPSPGITPGTLSPQKSVGVLKSQISGIPSPGLKSQSSTVGQLKAQQSAVLRDVTNNAGGNAAQSQKGISIKMGRGGYTVSAKHSWLLKSATINPRSSAEFIFGRIIGRGLMGVVRIVKHVPSDSYIAIKGIRKDYIEKHNDSRHVEWEREALGTVKSSFVPKLFGTFQDESYVYLAMELAVGGELFRRLSRKQSLGPQTAKFYTCEIFSALGHIHEMGYVYRDLKPENVMVDEEGHCKLVDFGFVTTPDSSGMMRTFCGTPAYLSPEQLDYKFTGGYTKICDWWSLGVFLYELRTGTPPFCRNHRETVYAVYTRILNNKISFPSHMQQDERDLISNLCLLNKEKRLTEPTEIKQTAYFRDIDWDGVEARQLIPPFVPALHSVGDDRFFEECPFESQAIKQNSTFFENNTIDREYYGFPY